MTVQIIGEGLGFDIDIGVPNCGNIGTRLECHTATMEAMLRSINTPLAGTAEMHYDAQKYCD